MQINVAVLLHILNFSNNPAKKKILGEYDKLKSKNIEMKDTISILDKIIIIISIVFIFIINLIEKLKSLL